MVLDLSGSSTFANPFVSRNEEDTHSYAIVPDSLNVTWSEFAVKTKRVYTRAVLQREYKRHRSFGTKRPRQSSIEATAIPRVFRCVTESGEGTVWDVESTGS